jgi:hypothetical protein
MEYNNPRRRDGTCSLTSVIDTASSAWANPEASARTTASCQKLCTKKVRPVNSAASSRQNIHIHLRPRRSMPQPTNSARMNSAP